jgi:hypothetical protein
VLSAALFFEHATLDRDTRGAQLADSRPRDIAVWIFMPDEYAANPRIDDRVRARTRASDPTAWLEGDRHRCAAHVLRTKATLRALQRDDLRVSAAYGTCCSTTQHTVAAKHDCTDRRVGMRASSHPPRHTQRDPHRRLGCHREGSIDSKNFR